MPLQKRDFCALTLVQRGIEGYYLTLHIREDLTSSIEIFMSLLVIHTGMIFWHLLWGTVIYFGNRSFLLIILVFTHLHCSLRISQSNFYLENSVPVSMSLNSKISQSQCSRRNGTGLTGSLGIDLYVLLIFPSNYPLLLHAYPWRGALLSNVSRLLPVWSG